MTHRLFCCIFLVLGLSGTAPAAPPVDPKKAGWDLVWADECDGAALDPKNWSLTDSYGRDACFGGGNQEQQCYSEDHSTIRLLEGHLALIAHPADNLPNGKSFKSARIQSRGKLDIRYGRIEASLKLPFGQGVWPAFWMLPSERTYGDWPHSGEIDIMEAVNTGTPCQNCSGDIENRVYGSMYFSDKWPRKGSVVNAVELGNLHAFNTFAVEWTPDSITWLINDMAYASVTSEDWQSRHPAADGNPRAPFDREFHLILNLAIGGNWPEHQNLGGVSREGFPKFLLVDHVRVYKCSTGPGTCSSRQTPHR